MVLIAKASSLVSRELQLAVPWKLSAELENAAPLPESSPLPLIGWMLAGRRLTFSLEISISGYRLTMCSNELNRDSVWLSTPWTSTMQLLPALSLT